VSVRKTEVPGTRSEPGSLPDSLDTPLALGKDLLQPKCHLMQSYLY